MRLSKRIAIGVMAAALALSMTACGGDVPEQPSNSGAGGTNTSTGSNTNTEPDDKKDDTNTPPKKDDDKKDDVQLETRTEKFFSGKNIINSSHWTYMLESTIQYPSGSEYFLMREIVASDGNRTYQTVENVGEDVKYIYDTKAKKTYRIFPNKNMVAEFPMGSIKGVKGALTYDCYYGKKEDISSRRSECKVGTYKVDETVYYCERYPADYANGIGDDIYCFDMSDTEGKYLRYYITENKNGDTITQTTIRKVSNIGNTFDTSLLKIPEGYDIYTYDTNKNSYVETGTKTGKDNYPN